MIFLVIAGVALATACYCLGRLHQEQASAAEIDRLTKLNAEDDRWYSQLIDERDHREEQINRIADVPGDEGEWSSCHDRGDAALELAVDLVARRNVAEQNEEP